MSVFLFVVRYEVLRYNQIPQAKYELKYDIDTQAVDFKQLPKISLILRPLTDTIPYSACLRSQKEHKKDRQVTLEVRTIINIELLYYLRYY